MVISPARILVIEDDSSISEMLARSLEYQGFDILVATDGATGIEQFRSFHPNLIVLDILLPEKDGWAVCARIRAESEVPILILTALDNAEQKVLGFASGADDYVTKPFHLEELLARVRALLKRSGGLRPQTRLAFRDLVLDVAAHTVTRGGTPINLTPTEFAILHLLLAKPGSVLNRGAISTAVWGRPLEDDTNLVDVHIAQLRRKLREPTLIHTVRGIGYVLKHEP